MSPQILSLIVFAENIHLNLNQPTEIVVCAPAFSISYFTNIAVQSVNKVRACAQEWTSSLRSKRAFSIWGVFLQEDETNITWINIQMLLETKNILSMPKTMGKGGGYTGGMQWVRTAPAVPPPPSTPWRKLWYSIFELRILLILKQLIPKKVFKHQHGGSSRNAFLNVSPKYKYCEDKFKE
jgi:hypothetical protein